MTLLANARVPLFVPNLGSCEAKSKALGMAHKAGWLGLSLVGLGRTRSRIVLLTIVKCSHNDECQQIKDKINAVLEGINRIEAAAAVDRELLEEIRLMVKNLQKTPPHPIWGLVLTTWAKVKFVMELSNVIKDGPASFKHVGSSLMGVYVQLLTIIMLLFQK